MLFGEVQAGRTYPAWHAAFQKPKVGKDLEIMTYGVSTDKPYRGRKPNFAYSKEESS